MSGHSFSHFLAMVAVKTATENAKTAGVVRSRPAVRSTVSARPAGPAKIAPCAPDE